MKIEKASNADFKDLSNLYFQLTEKITNIHKISSVFEKIYNNEFYHLLVARNEQNKVIGTAMGILCYDLVSSCDPFMLIENVVVLDSHRGKGIGKMLMLELESIAYSNKCSLTMLISGNTRKEAHNFYENLGYLTEKGFKKKLTYVDSNE